MEQQQNCGRLQSEQRGLYTSFHATVSPETQEVQRLFAIYEEGETALGIPAPESGKLELRISVPTAKLPGGRLLRGELRPKPFGWKPFPGGCIGKTFVPKCERNDWDFRFHWEEQGPIPCEELLCFFNARQESGGTYLLLHLNENGNPSV